MSSTRSRMVALAVLAVAVAGSGIVALGTVCDFDPQCGEPVDRTYELAHAGDDAALTYVLILDDGVVSDESVAWTASPPETDGSSGDGPGEVFYLAVHKNDIPLDPGIRHTLENGTGVLTWDSRTAETDAQAGDRFTFTLYAEAEAEEVVLHRTQVAITP